MPVPVPLVATFVGRRNSLPCVPSPDFPLASSWLCESLTEAGFSVEKGICDLPTAFLARAGSGPLNIGICAEYDCLPDIGHACGHNIIAASAVGAAVAAAKVADEVGLTVTVIGTRRGEEQDADHRPRRSPPSGAGGVDHSTPDG